MRHFLIQVPSCRWSFSSKAYVRGYSGCRQKTEPAELFPFPSVRRVVSYGGRTHMEDTHICVGDLAKKFGYNDVLSEEAISFYGKKKQVFDGHGGKDAAQFVRDNLPRVVVEDADFPLELEKVITRSFMETDAAFTKTCSRVFPCFWNNCTHCDDMWEVFACGKCRRLPGCIVTMWRCCRNVKRS